MDPTTEKQDSKKQVWQIETKQNFSCYVCTIWLLFLDYKISELISKILNFRHDEISMVQYCMQRERHETEILKRLEPGLVRKNNFNEQKNWR